MQDVPTWEKFQNILHPQVVWKKKQQREGGPESGLAKV